MKGKGGLLRGGLLFKNVDYSGRLNVVGDISLPLGYIGLPYQVVLKLYEPFTEHAILKDNTNIPTKELIKQQMGIDKDLSPSDLKNFLTFINEQPEDVSAELEDNLVKIAEDIVKDKNIIYKRDPVQCRNNYMSGYIRVDRNSRVIHLCPLDCPRTTGDFDGDTFAVYPLFSKEANEQAIEHMNPRTSKFAWTDPINSNNIVYKLDLDAVANIYTATKE